MMLEVRGLNQYYGGSHTLRDVSLRVRAGSVTALMGRNGVGKSTLLQCIVGLLPAASGDIVFDGQTIHRMPAEARAVLGIALVPQGRMIFPRLTVEENLRVALAARTDRARQIPELVYDLFPVLADMRRRRGGDLSGGQQQQLAIGRALVQGPKLLLLDEPCEGIQPSIVRDIAASIGRLNRDLGMTIVVVEQHLNFVRSVADDYYVLQRGSIRSEGPIDALDDDVIEAYLKV